MASLYAAVSKTPPQLQDAINVSLSWTFQFLLTVSSTKDLRLVKPPTPSPKQVFSNIFPSVFLQASPKFIYSQLLLIHTCTSTSHHNSHLCSMYTVSKAEKNVLRTLEHFSLRCQEDCPTTFLKMCNTERKKPAGLCVRSWRKMQKLIACNGLLCSVWKERQGLLRRGLVSTPTFYWWENNR